MRGGLHRPDPCRVSQVAYSRRVPAFHVEGLQRLRTVESAFGTCPSCISVPLLPHVNGWGVTREAEPAASGGERSGRRPPPSSSRRLSAPLPNQQDRGSGWGDCVHLRHPLRVRPPPPPAPRSEWRVGGRRGAAYTGTAGGRGQPWAGMAGEGENFLRADGRTSWRRESWNFCQIITQLFHYSDCDHHCYMG